jgi:hypothetical protein
VAGSPAAQTPARQSAVASWPVTRATQENNPARPRGADLTTLTTATDSSNPVTDLVTRAAGGDKQAWDALVERYIPLVWSICRRHRLNHPDARDVSQTVWRQLASQLGTLRNPAALARWLAATTQRECDRIRRGAPGPEQRPPAVSEAARTER